MPDGGDGRNDGLPGGAHCPRRAWAGEFPRVSDKNPQGR
jgi:hypothetical protein